MELNHLVVCDYKDTKIVSNSQLVSIDLQFQPVVCDYKDTKIVSNSQRGDGYDFRTIGCL